MDYAGQQGDQTPRKRNWWLIAIGVLSLVAAVVFAPDVHNYDYKEMEGALSCAALGIILIVTGWARWRFRPKSKSGENK